MGVLRAVGGVDADVFSGEIAGPIAGDGGAGVEMDDDGNALSEELVAGGAFVEIEWLAAFQDFDSRHSDFDERWIEFDARAAGCGEDAAPVGVAAGESGFDERRSGDGLCDLFGRGFSLGSADFDFDDALGAFSVGDNLLGERAADAFERGGELAVSFGAVGDRWCAGGAVSENEKRVVGGSVAVNADGVEGAASNFAESAM